ncbi:kinase-like domain-containing protein [Hypoxylon sp. NC0597]|nr:kinase-like domain-containing protein [Hypoxylon sp. NC0597]
MADDEYEKLLREVSSYFIENYQFRNGRPIGSGAYATAIVFDEDLPGKQSRKVVVKAALNADSDRSIINEDEHLKSVRGAEHTVRLLYSNILAFSHRAIVIEYIEHGHWEDILGRFISGGQRIPNRVLWGVFLCLTRAVIGMAWPQYASINDKSQRERIRNDPPGRLAHQDFSLQNILVGVWKRDDPEHRFSPITKVIDFGNAAVLPPQEGLGDATGIADNISEIGRVMLWLAIGHRGYEIMECEIQDGPNLPLRTIESRVHYDLSDGSISDQLRFLIRRCRAVNPKERPKLPDLLRVCENAVLNHNAADYADLNQPWPQYEHDHELDRLIQRFILNADP